VTLFIAERPFGHLVKTLVVNDVDYKYYDVTSVEPNYGKFLGLFIFFVEA